MNFGPARIEITMATIPARRTRTTLRPDQRRARPATASRPTARDPLTRTQSPGWTTSQAAEPAAGVVAAYRVAVAEPAGTLEVAASLAADADEHVHAESRRQRPTSRW